MPTCAGVAVAAFAIGGCSLLSQGSPEAVVSPPAPVPTEQVPAPMPVSPPVASVSPVPIPKTAPPAPIVKSSPTAPVRSTATAYLTVPKAGIYRVKIVTYSGVPDDARGTQINDAGLVGAPRGSWGGVAPGQVGNLLLTGHRTSAGAPMGQVPRLSAGDKIFVDQGSARYVYTVSTKAKINFRSAASRALQAAAVPGSPGKPATRPAIVLSTCATPEDNADGNFWRDEHDNPTHRIAVYGYLQSVVAR